MLPGAGKLVLSRTGGAVTITGSCTNFWRNDALDASSFGSMGNYHLVQNNLGASLGGSLTGKNGSTPLLLRLPPHTLSVMPGGTRCTARRYRC